MRHFLDPQLLIWAADDLPRRSATARALMLAPENLRGFSVCGIWEIAIKTGLGREAFYLDATVFRNGLLANDYRELPILARRALLVPRLPAIHKDPFDRLLVA